ncbi:MAG: amino acid adenylation domain-containing protein, partial [Acidobacteria bacterium]|nr:amino acid adenylation domain-containing protein [Acidobacteriota bacterium]
MRQEIIENYRLSPQQRDLWLSLQNCRGLDFYAQCAISIDGKLDRATLEKALQQVIERHEILHTAYRLLAEVALPLQVITDNQMPEIDIRDLSEMEAAEQEIGLASILEEMGRVGLERAEPPLIDLTLVALAPFKHILLIGLPGLSTDKASLANLMREICSAYAVCQAAQELPRDTMQYPDLTEWQNELFVNEEAEQGKQFWRLQKASGQNLLKLPFERNPLEEAAFAPRSLSLTLDEKISEIDVLADKYETSAEIVLRACWQILFARLTGQSDLSISYAYDGRIYEELEKVLGLFARYLPLSNKLWPAMRFGDFLKQAHLLSQEAYDWQECFSWDSSADSAPPLFPVSFEFEVWPKACCAAEISFSIYKLNHCLGRYIVKLCCVRKGNSLLAEFHYDASLIEESDMRLLAEQFHTLLESILCSSEVRLDELEVLSCDERRKLLDEFNHTKIDFPKDHFVHQLFEAQVERRPDTVAIVVDDCQVTYDALNRRANQLANYLRNLGIRPESLVALLMERSPEWLVGLLAVRKAGGAFLPFDPVWPRDRLLAILVDAQPLILLTQQKLVDKLPNCGAGIICIDNEWHDISQLGEENIETTAMVANLAYVIYTSGSSGNPKGVAVEDRQLFNYVNGIQEKLGLNPGSSFATVSTFAADLGYSAIFPSICSGGCLHIISADLASDPDALGDYFLRHPIDCLKIVPSHLSALIGNSNSERLMPHLRLVLGGETSSWSLIERLRELNHTCRIYNHYGPTETTVGVLTCQLEDDPSTGISISAPLGSPIANTNVYLLNSVLKPVPTWHSGQIYIGGNSVGRGYLNSPDLTAERFVPHLFSAKPGARYYESGDLGRFLPDGRIEFLGRVDHQVKIHGYRVEVGEIEAALRQHPCIRECVTLIKEDNRGERSLVAYIVPIQEQIIDAAQVRSFLKARLPEYMVPTAIVALKALPLTPNGKVDRRALPDLERLIESSSAAYVAPRTTIEEILAGIWSRMLEIGQVGVNDNFFDLGGHSLLAMRLVSKLRLVFQVEIALRTLFESPTLRAMAEIIEKELRAGGIAEAQSIRSVIDQQIFELSFPQQRIWFFDQMAPGNATYNIPAHARITGPLNISTFDQSLCEIIRRHEVLRARVTEIEGQPMQVINPEVRLALPLVDLRGLSEEELLLQVKRLSTEEMRKPFDLTRGPLLRSTLLRLDKEEHVALLTMNHFVSDGWSVGILMRDAGLLYQAFTEGKPSAIKELTIQYTDFAVWQRQRLQGHTLETQLSYWRQQLAGSSHILPLPTDRPRPVIQNYRGARHLIFFTADLSKEVRQFSRIESATVYMTLLAAFQALLYRYTGQEDLSVGTPIAGRSHIDTEELIGYFANTLALRTDLSNAPTFRELLRRVREMALGAYANQDVPFEMLVEMLQPERDLSYNPLFQVLFALGNTPIPRSQLSKLTLSLLPADGATARFDLALDLSEGEAGLRGSIEHNTDLFDLATIARMAAHYQMLLSNAIMHPDQPITTLPLLTLAEREQVLLWWNNSKSDFSRNNQSFYFSELFELQALRIPDAVAVVYFDQHLSYGELNERANQ